jgi:hypothetical protein
MLAGFSFGRWAMVNGLNSAPLFLQPRVDGVNKEVEDAVVGRWGWRRSFLFRLMLLWC